MYQQEIDKTHGVFDKHLLFGQDICLVSLTKSSGSLDRDKDVGNRSPGDCGPGRLIVH